ncbi:MAG: DUF2520 domain-containing protein [Acidobacteria bacterium]|nr:DUF2520 domain-containing protein [Acidobacteriota bacterium]
MSGEQIGIAGAGRIGQALGRLLRERGEPVAAVASRTLERARAAAAFIGGGAEPVSYSQLPGCATRVLIAIPDQAIASVAATLAGAGMAGGMALHTCGAHGAEILAPLAARGVSCAALHPLQTVASPERGVAELPGASFAIEGEGPALDWAARIAGLLQGQMLRIPPGRRPLYHAAAVLASNCVVGLLDAAVVLLGECGIDREQALRALAPLARASVSNTAALGPIQALTGPIERGDAGTVAVHLRSLAGVPGSVGELYRQCGLYLAGLARRKSPGADFRELEQLLREGRKDHE